MKRWIGLVMAGVLGLGSLQTGGLLSQDVLAKGKGKAKGHQKAKKAKKVGKKVGWGGKDVPPGIARQGEEKGKRAKAKGLSDDEIAAEMEAAAKGLDKVAGAGVPVRTAGEILRESIERGMTKEDIQALSEILAEKAREGVDPKKMAEKTKAIIKEKAGKANVIKAVREWAAQAASDAIQGTE
ncbi:MAG: hypothetical protein ACYTGH_09975 [Planctomycetota bacterium]